MRGNVIETVMGAVVLVVAALFLVFAYKTSQFRAVSGYEVNADFARIDGIRQGSDVRISGVKVGTVVAETLDPKTFLATIRMSIDPAVQLPDDTVARDHLVGAARRQVHVPGPRRIGQDDPAGRQDQIHAILGQPGKPDRPDDLLRAGGKKSRARAAPARRRRPQAPPAGCAGPIAPSNAAKACGQVCPTRREEFPVWRTPEGEPVSCVEKIKVLNENLAELRALAQDALEDAVLMGCDERQVREVSPAIVTGLVNPTANEERPGRGPRPSGPLGGAVSAAGHRCGRDDPASRPR